MSVIPRLADWITEKILEFSSPDILELGTMSFRRASFVRQGARLVLKTLQTTPAPESLVFSPGLNMAVFRDEQFLAAIRELYPEGLTRRYVAVILPDSAFQFGLVSIPTVAVRGGVLPLVEREVQNLAPLPLTEYSLNFELGQVRGNKRDLLYAGLPCRVVPEMFALLESIGLAAISVHPSFVCLLGLIRTLEDEQAAYPSVFLHIGREATIVGITMGGKIRRIQTIASGGETVNQLLATRLNQSREEIETLKKKEIILLEDPTSEAQLEIPAYQVLEPYFVDLLQKVYGLLQLHSSQVPAEAGYRRILLSGGGANLPNFDRLISENLGLPVQSVATLVKAGGLTDRLDKETINGLAPILGGAHLQFWKSSRADRVVE